MDKYDLAVEYFRKNPDRIEKEWNHAICSPDEFPHGAVLFGPVARVVYRETCCGCLSQVAAGVMAETEELATAIRADERIPRVKGTERDEFDRPLPFAIKVKHLPIFAEWRRRIDKYFETGELI
jgi:hypothetical protein